MKSYNYNVFLYTLLLAFLTAALPLQEASAQPASVDEASVAKAPVQATPSDRWAENVGKQARWLLQFPDAERQDRAMMLILRYANRDPELPVDFRPAVSELFKIYESNAKDGRRLLALAALQAIGEPYVLKRLAKQAQNEHSEKVYRQTLRVLAAHQD